MKINNFQDDGTDKPAKKEPLFGKVPGVVECAGTDGASRSGSHVSSASPSALPSSTQRTESFHPGPLSYALHASPLQLTSSRTGMMSWTEVIIATMRSWIAFCVGSLSDRY